MKKRIPPVQKCVQAGFVVYSPETPIKQLLIVEEGCLGAFQCESRSHKAVFELRKGDMIGVASLLEKEAIPWKIIALEESKYCVVNEESMESQLSFVPVWLVALIKSLSMRTRELKSLKKKTPAPHLLHSLTLYLFHQKQEALELDRVLKEFSFLTRATATVTLQALRYLENKGFLKLKKQSESQSTHIVFPEPLITAVLLDFWDAKQSKNHFFPFQLSDTELSCLESFLKSPVDFPMESAGYLQWLQDLTPSISVKEWIHFQSLGLFFQKEDGTFQADFYKIEKALLAIRHAPSLRKIIL